MRTLINNGIGFFMLCMCEMLTAQQWQHIGLSNEEVSQIRIDKNDTQRMYAASLSSISTGKVGSLFGTTDGGIHWDTLIKNINVTDIDIHPIRPNVIFAVSAVNALNPSRIYRSNDWGKTWIRSDSGMIRLPWSGPYILEFNNTGPDTMYASTAGDDGGAVYISTNGGTFWSKMQPLENFDGGASVIVSDPTNGKEVFIGTGWLNRIYYSSDYGFSWVVRNAPNEMISTLGFHRSGRIYFGTSAVLEPVVGLFFTDDTFKTWEYWNPGFTSTTHVRQLIVTGDSVYFRGSDNLYRTINHSILQKVNIGDNKCRTVSLNGNTLYVGTENGIIKSDIISAMGEVSPSALVEYTLYQNYPNPFNPSTRIDYELPRSETVTLTIYDMLGREVTTLVDQPKEAGRYSVTWDASAFTAGVYFLRMQAGQYTATKKIVLVK